MRGPKKFISIMKKILAVSGGVDSVVMLDFCCQFYARNELIVAHFDHGIRSNSHEDCEFVQRLAAEYGVEFVSGQAQLGEEASEALAREHRYGFLYDLADKHCAEIFTAHHLDDLVETVAINLIRGTGWRGLAVLDAPRTRRPFLETEFFYEPLDKAAIVEYAAKRGLRFREDQTNSDQKFLRNRVRAKLNNTFLQDDDTFINHVDVFNKHDDKFSKHDDTTLRYEDKLKIWQLWQEQRKLRHAIDEEVNKLLPQSGVYERAWFKGVGDAVALEVLRAATLRAGVSATRPQLGDFLIAIRTFNSGKQFNLPGDRLVKFTKTEFSL